MEKSNDGSALSTAMPSFTIKQSVLEGTWSNLCALDTKLKGIDFQMIIVAGNRLSVISYGNFSFPGFNINGQITWQGLFEIRPGSLGTNHDFLFWTEAIRIIPLDDDSATTLNQRKFCNVPNWQKTVEKETTSLICDGIEIPQVGYYIQKQIILKQKQIQFDFNPFLFGDTSSNVNFENPLILTHR